MESSQLRCGLDLSTSKAFSSTHSRSYSLISNLRGCVLLKLEVYIFHQEVRKYKEPLSWHHRVVVVAVTQSTLLVVHL